MHPARPASSAGAPPSSASGMRLTELLAEVQERLDAVGRTQGRIQHLLDAFLSVSTGLDLDTTLRRIVEAGVALVDARYGALGVLRDGGGLAAFIHVGIDDETRARMGHLPEGKGCSASSSPSPIRSDPRPEPTPLLGRLPPNHPPMRSFLGVPVLVRGEVFGNLYLTEKAKGAFTAEDEAILTALAGAAGIAIDNARLYEEGEVRRRWLSAVSDVRAALLDATSPAEALGLIAERVATLTGADATWVLRGPDPGDGTYTVAAQIGDGLDDVTGSALSPAESPVLEAVEAAGGSVVAVDLSGLEYGDPTTTSPGAPASACAARTRRTPCSSWAARPDRRRSPTR